MPILAVFFCGMLEGMSKVVESVIKNYLYYFGKTNWPVVWAWGPLGDGVSVAKGIYGGHEDWFWSSAGVVTLLPDSEYPEARVREAGELEGQVDVLMAAGKVKALEGLRNRLDLVRVVCVKRGAEAEMYLKGRGFTLVDELEGQLVFVRS